MQGNNIKHRAAIYILEILYKEKAKHKNQIADHICKDIQIKLQIRYARIMLEINPRFSFYQNAGKQIDHPKINLQD